VNASRGSENEAERRARRAALVCAAAALAIALASLIGWFLDIAALYRVLPYGPPVQPVTAIAIAALSLAMMVRASQWSSPARLFLASLVGVLVGLGAILMAADYTFGWNVSFERWLFAPLLVTLYPRKISPLTAAALFFLSAELVVSQRRRLQSLATALSSGAGFIAVVALAAHLYGTRYVYELPNRSVMAVALGTAVALLLLATSQLLCGFDRAPMRILRSRRTGGFSARRLVVVVFAAPVVVGITVQVARRLGLRDVPLALAIVGASVIPVGLLLVALHARALDAFETLRQENDERFCAFFQQACDAIVTASRSGHITDASDSAVELVGRDFVGRPITDLVAPRERRRLLATLRSLEAGASVRGEWTIRTAAGVDVPVEVNAKMLSTGQWLIAARDVRDRRAAEQNLARAGEAEHRAREQLEAIASATDAVGEALAALPREGLDRVLRTIALQAQTLTNARYAAIGLIDSRGDRASRPWTFTSVPDEILEQVETGAPLDRSMRGFLAVPIRHHGETIGNVYLAEKRDSSVFTADDERMVALLANRVGSAIETARLYQLEARAHSWLQNVIDQLPDGVIVTDAGGVVMSVNRGARPHVRNDRGVVFEARGPDGKTIAWKDLPLACALERCEVTSNRELAILREDGEYVPVLACATPIWGEDDSVAGAMIAFHDITRQKQLERMREQWTSIIAHDLRQPVAVISVAAQMLERRGVVTGEAAEVLKRILGGCGKLDRMIHDLLDASRIEAQRMTIECSPIDFTALLREILERADAVLHGTPARLDIRGPLPWISGDSGRIEQIVLNLLSNAAKYGDPKREVVVAAEARDGGVVVSVTNHGRGITPDELPRLFSRFERTRAARSSREGVGLGLYITKGLVEAHGGHIEVESTPNAQTTFRFTLPAPAARPSRPSRKSRPSAVPA
jgi:PAS domain S-box-containing protein